MKKITLLMSSIVCVVFAQAQTNLLVNPGFENWAAGVPTGWTIVSPSNGSVSQATNVISEGTSSFKVVGGSGTFTVNQAVAVTAGKTYNIIMNYFIEAGDGTDARIWCNFKNTSGAYWKMNLADSLAMKGPNATSTGGYFPDVKGSWQTYSYNVVAPAGYEIFSFEFRTYKTPAIVYWDKLFFGEKIAGFSSLKADALSVTLKGCSLSINNVADGSTVDIFSTLGAKVQTSKLENNAIQLNNLSRGLYVVRVGNMTSKIMM
jgi:hypothetical protein